MSGFHSSGALDELEMDYNMLARATDNWAHWNRLGAGAFGAVYKGTLEDGNEVAIKVIESNPDQAGFDDEVRILSRFRHPNLVILMGFARGSGGSGSGTEKQKHMLVYELLSGGDVHHRIRWAREGAGRRETCNT